MNIENYFEQEKGITVDAARNAGARYTAIDICRFAKKYHESEVKNLSSNTMLADRLPTDEEIVDEAEGRYPVKRHNNPDDSPYVGTQKTFIHGVRWALAFVQGNYR